LRAAPEKSPMREPVKHEVEDKSVVAEAAQR